jgi:hypothetical protein
LDSSESSHRDVRIGIVGCKNERISIFGDEVAVSNTPQVTIDETPSAIIPRCSGRIVKAPDRFIFLGEAYEAIPEEPELDSRTYDEAVNDVDAMCTIGSKLWQPSWNP